MLISVDPGLKTSGTGVAWFSDQGRLLGTNYIPPHSKPTSIRDMVNPVIEYLNRLSTGNAYNLVIEESFYPGLANKLHQGYLHIIKYFFSNVTCISPLTVKKEVTGTGKASKDEVKKFLQDFYAERTDMTDIENEHTLIDWTKPDVVDAVAIGLAFMKKYKRGLYGN